MSVSIVAYGQARPVYYDRNPLTNRISYVAGSVAPHGSTSRATYTVPTGRKAFVSLIQGELLRQTAAAPAGDAQFIVRDLTGGAHYLTQDILTNGVGDKAQAVMGANMTMLAAEVIQILTGDGSIGGTFYYSITAQSVEFDA